MPLRENSQESGLNDARSAELASPATSFGKDGSRFYSRPVMNSSY
jgi:hypothetical protein